MRGKPCNALCVQFVFERQKLLVSNSEGKVAMQRDAGAEPPRLASASCWRSPEKMNADELSRTRKFTGGHWEFGAANAAAFSKVYSLFIKKNLQLKRAAILPTCTAPSPLLSHAIP
jgi:hypothetical protein